jgi:hypothetical protein
MWYIVQGPLTSRWFKFIKRLKIEFDKHITLLPVLSNKVRTPVLIPIELISSPKDLPHGKVFVYISGEYQIPEIVKLVNILASRPKIIVSSGKLGEELFTRTGHKHDYVLPLELHDKSWAAFLNQRTADKEEDRVALHGPTLIDPAPYFPPPRQVHSVRTQSGRSSIVYAANSTYQIEHILPLLKILPGPVVIPAKQYRMLAETETLKQFPDISQYSANISMIDYPDEFRKFISNKFLITTGSFRRMSARDYPNSLFVCHGISDKLGYHSGAARSGFKYYASSGPRFTQVYTRHGVPEDRIIKCGYIRSTIQAQPYPEFDILFAPTHHAGTVLPYIDNIIKSCKKLGLSLHVRLHPLTEPSIIHKIQNNIIQYIPPGRVSTWSLLKACKYVITDISSISYEALLLGKQMLLVDGPGGWTKLERLPSGKFGLVVPYEQSNRLDTYIKRMLNGESESRVPVTDVFYMTTDPAEIVKQFLTDKV